MALFEQMAASVAAVHDFDCGDTLTIARPTALANPLLKRSMTSDRTIETCSGARTRTSIVARALESPFDGASGIERNTELDEQADAKAKQESAVTRKSSRADSGITRVFVHEPDGALAAN
jgi:hypothetical protein